MSLKTRFAELAAALSHLRSASDKVLFPDQQAQIDAAIAGLKETEHDYEAGLKADLEALIPTTVKAAVDEALAAFRAQLDDFGGRVAALEDAGKEIDAGLADLKSAVESVVNAAAPVAAPAAAPELPQEPAQEAPATAEPPAPETAAQPPESGPSGEETTEG